MDEKDGASISVLFSVALDVIRGGEYHWNKEDVADLDRMCSIFSGYILKPTLEFNLETAATVYSVFFYLARLGRISLARGTDESEDDEEEFWGEEVPRIEDVLYYDENTERTRLREDGYGPVYVETAVQHIVECIQEEVAHHAKTAGLLRLALFQMEFDKIYDRILEARTHSDEFRTRARQVMLAYVNKNCPDYLDTIKMSISQYTFCDIIDLMSYITSLHDTVPGDIFAAEEYQGVYELLYHNRCYTSEAFREHDTPETVNGAGLAIFKDITCKVFEQRHIQIHMHMSLIDRDQPFGRHPPMPGDFIVFGTKIGFITQGSEDKVDIVWRDIYKKDAILDLVIDYCFTFDYLSEYKMYIKDGILSGRITDIDLAEE